MYSGQYVPVRIGRKVILMWDGQKTIAFRGSHVHLFRAKMKKAFAQKKKVIQGQQYDNLHYLGIYNKQLLNKCVKYYFEKLVEGYDQTEIAKASGKDIWTD